MTKDKDTPKPKKVRPTEVITPDAAKRMEEALGHEKAEEIISVVMKSSITTSGPLPMASQFASYEETYPGAAREILEMAKKEQEHRHLLAKKDLSWGIGHQYIALVGGILALVLCIGGAIFLALKGLPVMAGALVGVAVLGVITTILRLRPSFSGRERLKQESNTNHIEDDDDNKQVTK